MSNQILKKIYIERKEFQLKNHERIELVTAL